MRTTRTILLAACVMFASSQAAMAQANASEPPKEESKLKIYRSWVNLDMNPPGAPARGETDPAQPAPERGKLIARCRLFATSDQVLDAAMKSEEVRQTAWFKESSDDAVTRLRKMLSTYVDTDQDMFVVMVSGTDRESLAPLANAVAGALISTVAEYHNRRWQNAIRVLRMERTALADKRDRVRADKAKMLREAQVPDVSAEDSVMLAELRRLVGMISDLEMEAAQCDARLQIIRKDIQEGSFGARREVMEFVERDPVICGLITQKVERAVQSARTKAMMEVMPRRTPPEGLRSRADGTVRSPADANSIPPAGGSVTEVAIDEQIEARKKHLTEEMAKTLSAEAETHKVLVLDRLVNLRDKYRQVEVVARDQQSARAGLDDLGQQDRVLTRQIDRLDEALLDLRIRLSSAPPLEILTPACTPAQKDADR